MNMKGTPGIKTWYMEVRATMGTKPFRFCDLPEHLQSKSYIMRARSRGLLTRSGCTLKGNNGQGVYLWKVRA
jgi:hypothetical protein